MGFQFLSNPILLAAVTLAAVGFAIYEIVSNQNRRQQHGNNRRAHPPHYRPPPPSPPPSPKKSTSETSVKRKSPVTPLCPPKSTDSDDSTSNNLRKRTCQIDSKSSDPSSKLLNLDVDEGNVDETNLDIKNYDKNVLDKIQNDVNRSYHFEKNITVDPDGPESNLTPDDDETSTIASACCSGSQGSYDADSDEEMYKKDVRDVLKNDIEFNEKACGSEETENVASGLRGTEFFDSLPTPPGICKACEQNRINARAYPCNHDYLCIDCAVKMFRLLRKCNICLAYIQEFKVIES